jgi:hypothetical protein
VNLFAKVHISSSLDALVRFGILPDGFPEIRMSLAIDRALESEFQVPFLGGI